MGARDGELFKEKIEVSLDGRQIFCLFCGGAVIASLVFVLGVMVGRRVEARTGPERAAAGSPASDPLAALDQLAADDTASDGQVPSALRDGESGPLGPVDVSLAKPITPPPPAEDEKPEEKPPVEEKVEAPKPVAEPAPPPAEGRFTLQLSSFQSRAEADTFIAELKKSGYTASVVQAEVEGKGTWFRVRLGSYASHDQALVAKREFESKQKIIAYVTRIKK
jgi:DedD protein